MTAKPAIALCSEYPLTFRGGVSIIVEETIRGLADEFDLWLVSPETTDQVLAHPSGLLLAGHLAYQTPALPPSPAYYPPARELVDRMRKAGVRLAHFHCGGIYGWGNRWPGASLPALARGVGLRTCWTNHSVVRVASSFLVGPRWKRAAMLPMAWWGKWSQIRAVDREIAVSRHDGDLLASRFPFRGKQIDVIYHSRLDDAAGPTDSRREPVILCVGHVAFRKGHHILVQAFLGACDFIPGWTLEVVGPDGGDGCWQAIEQQVAHHPQGHRVRLVGECENVLPLMGRAGLFVQPSLEEALGLAAQEALFMGCPVIASRVGGLPEVIAEGITGLLVPPGDVGALADVITRCIQDNAGREGMGQAARRSIERKGMTRRQMVDSLRSLYMELVAPPDRADRRESCKPVARPNT